MGLPIHPLVLGVQQEGGQPVFQGIVLVPHRCRCHPYGFLVGCHAQRPKEHRVGQHLLPAMLPLDHPAAAFRLRGHLAAHLLHPQQLHFPQKAGALGEIQDGHRPVFQTGGALGPALHQIDQLGELLPRGENHPTAGVHLPLRIGGDVKREQIFQGFSLHLCPSSVRFLLLLYHRSPVK